MVGGSWGFAVVVVSIRIWEWLPSMPVNKLLGSTRTFQQTANKLFRAFRILPWTQTAATYPFSYWTPLGALSFFPSVNNNFHSYCISFGTIPVTYTTQHNRRETCHWQHKLENITLLPILERVILYNKGLAISISWYAIRPLYVLITGLSSVFFFFRRASHLHFQCLTRKARNVNVLKQFTFKFFEKPLIKTVTIMGTIACSCWLVYTNVKHNNPHH